MIDFSAIPNAKTSGSPWDSLKWAIIIFLGIASAVALGALVTALTGHRDTIMPLISGAMFLGFIGIVIYAFAKGYQGFRKQKLWMQEFAKDNNWRYDDSKQTVNDLVAYPPQYTKLASSWSDVRCTVSGEVNNIGFELAHITYLQSTGLVGILLENSYGRNRKRFAWTSVLRLEGHPELQESPNFIYENDDSYTYVICGLNALYRDDIQTMFESVTSYT